MAATVHGRSLRMVAFLLYGIGLLLSAGTAIIALLNAPGPLSALWRGLTAANADYLGTLVGFGRAFAWTVEPFVGGLVLMGFSQMVAAFRRR